MYVAVLEPSRFVGEVPPDLLCHICQQVLSEPLETPCQHAFCADCIRQWLNKTASCPVDRKPVTIPQLNPLHRVVRSLLDQLIIKCDFVERGCTHTMRLETRRSHVLTCGYGDGLCGYRECALNEHKTAEEYGLLKKDVAAHETTCNFRLVVCAVGCGKSFPKGELEATHTRAPSSVLRCLHIAPIDPVCVVVRFIWRIVICDVWRVA